MAMNSVISSKLDKTGGLQMDEDIISLRHAKIMA